MPGINQREARRLAQTPGAVRTSCHLVRVLMQYWAWGFLSPQMMQRIAHAARSDVRAKKREILLQCGKTDEADNDEETFYDLDILNNLGCEGKFSNNGARDLRNHVIRSRTAEPLHVKMPLKDATSVRHMNVDQCMFLPHAWFASMYNDYPESFKERIAQTTTRLSASGQICGGHRSTRNSPDTLCSRARSTRSGQSRFPCMGMGSL